jgi:uncharacterized protein
MKPRPIVLALLLALPLCAGAAGRTSSHDQAVHELFNVMGLERNAVVGATAMIDAQIQANPAIEPYRGVMVDWATRFLTWDAMLPEMTAIYKETFTEDEVREMIAFYRTPTGQKVLDTLPEVMQRSAGVGVSLAQKHQAELESMVAKRRKELEAASR